MKKKIDIHNNALILLYHGVTSNSYNDIKNYSGKHLHINNFSKQMKILSSSCNTVSLRKLSEMLTNRKKLPYRTVAVTFDDCFQNIYHNALPVLKKYKIPATFFINTGYIGTDRIIWTDILELIIADYKEERINFNFIDFSKDYNTATNEQKIKTLLDIKSIIKSIDENKKQKIMKYFSNHHQLKLSKTTTDLYLNLNWNHIKEIDSDDLFEIGAHTVNHIILSYVDLETAKKEIINSKKMIEQNLRKTVDLFSYPEGQENHYNDDIIQILKEQNFLCSPSAIWGDNEPGADLFHLKRIMVGFNNIIFPYF